MSQDTSSPAVELEAPATVVANEVNTSLEITNPPIDELEFSREEELDLLYSPEDELDLLLEEEFDKAEESVVFVDIAQFKQDVGALSFTPMKRAWVKDGKPVLDPKTGLQKMSYFVSFSNGFTTKCQRNIDTSKPMKFLVSNGILEEACLINTDSANVTSLGTF